MTIPPHPRRAEAEALLRQGVPIAEVARRVRANRVTVSGWARQLGLARTAGRTGGTIGPLAQEILAALLGDREAGIPPRSLSQIASDFRIRPYVVDGVADLLSDGEEK